MTPIRSNVFVLPDWGNDMLTSRDISELVPSMRPLAQTFVDKCKANGIDVILTATYRDYEAQDALYAKGRTGQGDIVTNAKGGESWHNFRLAFDFCPIEGGKAAWNDAALFEKCGDIGESLGLVWAGRWTGTLRETAHFQMSANKLTLADLQLIAGGKAK
jgi:peptidoglycan LD-endopeptidase CwlK